MTPGPELWGAARAARRAAVLALALGLAACAGPAAPASPAPQPQASGTRALAASPTATPASTVEPAADGSLTLTWWAPEFLSPAASDPAGPLLAQQIAELEAAQEGRIAVKTVLKAMYGRGGLWSSLRAAQPVAPGILPDVVALDLAEVGQAVAAGLLQPIEFAEGEAPELYPWARTAGEFGGRLMAVPCAADVGHVIYRAGLVAAPPADWAALLEGQTPYLFPLGAPQPDTEGRPVDALPHAVLGHYISAGGEVDPATGQPVLRSEPLVRLLEFYRDAAGAGLLPERARDLGDAGAAWSAYLEGQIPMAYVPARRYLAGGTALADSQVAPAPGWSGAAPPVATGWALAIVTSDPERQRAAAGLIAWLMQPENAGAWTRAAGWLPTTAGALATWGDGGYNDFLRDLLPSAVAAPRGAGASQSASRLRAAIAQVLGEGVDPAEAARAAIEPAP